MRTRRRAGSWQAHERKYFYFWTSKASKLGIYLVLEPRPYAVNEHHCLGCAADLVLLYRALDLLRHESRVDQRVDFSCNDFCVTVLCFCTSIFTFVQAGKVSTGDVERRAVEDYRAAAAPSASVFVLLY